MAPRLPASSKILTLVSIRREGYDLGEADRSVQSSGLEPCFYSHGATEQIAMTQCSTCGSNVPETATVCVECGTELTSLAPPEAGSHPISPDPARAAPPAGATPAPAAPSAPPLQGSHPARLTLRRGGALTGEVFPLGAGTSVIGRFDPEAGPVDVDLGLLPESVYISRRHAEVWRDGAGTWFVKDLGSGNGTFVADSGQSRFRKANPEEPLKNGDEIAFGNARFEFVIS